MAQYDHGPKETANNSIVIQIVAQGKSYERTLKLGDTIARAGAHVFTVEEPESRRAFFSSVQHPALQLHGLPSRRTFGRQRHLYGGRKGDGGGRLIMID